jgi:hypothetical protein
MNKLDQQYQTLLQTILDFSNPIFHNPERSKHLNSFIDEDKQNPFNLEQYYNETYRDKI